MRKTAAVALGVGAVVAGFAWLQGRVLPGYRGDVEIALAGARAWLGGADAYNSTGPVAGHFTQWPQYYPATAFVSVLPLAPLRPSVAGIAFLGLSAAWLAFALARRRTEILVPVLGSGAFLFGVYWRQWSPALVAASLTPAAAGLLAAKPTTGLGLLAGTSRRTFAWAVVGGAALAALAFAAQPTWVMRWIETLRAHRLHFVAPVTRLPFGPLVLLALLRWRRPEARMLVALACIPQTNAVSDVLPLLLVAGTFGEAALLAFSTHAVGALQARASLHVDNLAAFAASCATSATWLLLAVYLPCVAMVLRRPNVAPVREGEPEAA